MHRLKILRENEQIKKKELAEHLDISIKDITSWEEGKAEPNIEQLIKLANFFDVSIDYLVCKEDALKKYIHPYKWLQKYVKDSQKNYISSFNVDIALIEKGKELCDLCPTKNFCENGCDPKCMYYQFVKDLED